MWAGCPQPGGLPWQECHCTRASHPPAAERQSGNEAPAPPTCTPNPVMQPSAVPRPRSSEVPCGQQGLPRPLSAWAADWEVEAPELSQHWVTKCRDGDGLSLQPPRLLLSPPGHPIIFQGRVILEGALKATPRPGPSSGLALDHFQAVSLLKVVTGDRDQTAAMITGQPNFQQAQGSPTPAKGTHAKLLHSSLRRFRVIPQFDH